LDLWFCQHWWWYFSNIKVGRVLKKMVRYEDIEPMLHPLGFVLRGGFYDQAQDRTIVLVGNVGSLMWESFSKDKDHWVEPDPLDHWTKFHLSKIAQSFHVKVVFPFEGPDYAPFQTWAMQADCVYPSPIGPLIHPEYGLWHAYRAAFLFDFEVANLPQPTKTISPCESCVDRPCISACPVQAFDGPAYDVAQCTAYLKSKEATSCLEQSCLSRRACPVGRDFQYSGDHAAFHMARFLNSFAVQGLDSL
jgi:hypothetical protein